MPQPITRVVLATHNPKKLAELRRIADAAGAGLTVVGLDEVGAFPEPAETEDTFEGNALIKARAACAATGLPALADDSGLEVDVLNRMPGVRTARWAGAKASDEANRRLVLAQVDDVPEGRRTARFVCAVALVLPDGREDVVTAALEGRLAFEESGSNGFGYDPIFIADGQSVTNANLTPDQKDAISHRGQAVRAMVGRIVQMNEETR